jgi:hypothetical protein
VAKSRVRSSKGSRTRKTAKTRRRAAAGPRRIQLKPVFNSLSTSIDRLERAEQTAAVKKALARLSQCLRSLDGICGSDMVIPVTKE